MSSKIKVGIVICDRYRRCTGGKCLRAMWNKEGAFSVYAESEVELVGLTTCDGCPGGNVEYAGEEMVKNGAQAIHLATGGRGLSPLSPRRRVQGLPRKTLRDQGGRWHASDTEKIS